MRISTRTFAIVATFAVAACGSEKSGEITNEDGETAEYTIDAESGETTMAITTEDGATAMQSGAGVEPDLPDGWTIYPGASILNAINVDRADGAGSMVIMNVEASADDVIAFYRKQAEATGFPIQMELTTATSRLIGGEKDDGSTFSVSVTPSEDGQPAMVQLTLADG